MLRVKELRHLGVSGLGRVLSSQAAAEGSRGPQSTTLLLECGAENVKAKRVVLSDMAGGNLN